VTPCYQQILGVKFFNGDVEEAIAFMSRQGGFLVAPSGTCFSRLRHDTAYRRAMMNADVAIPDSGAMVLLWRILRGRKIARISGLKYLQRLVRPRIAVKVTRRAAKPGNSMAKLGYADETMPIAFLLVGQQRSDKGSLFRQEMFCSKIVRVAARAFFMAAHGQYGSADCKCAGRFRARCPHAAEGRQRLLFFSQAETRQAECCARCPVPRFLSNKNLSFALRRFSCAIRRAE
jgi:hypothetical protein